MTGKTHLAAGITAALALVQPQTASLAAACVIGGGLGGLVPDVDARASEQGRDARVAWLLLAAIVAASLLVDGFSIQSLWAGAFDQAGPVPVIAAVVFVGTCMVGSLTPHRSFMHSILAAVILTASLWHSLPSLAAPFAVGFASHVALDLLNSKGVRILFPLKAGFSLGICSSGGTIDHAIFLVCAFSAISLLSRVAL